MELADTDIVSDPDKKVNFYWVVFCLLDFLNCSLKMSFLFKVIRFLKHYLEIVIIVSRFLSFCEIPLEISFFSRSLSFLDCISNLQLFFFYCSFFCVLQTPKLYSNRIFFLTYNEKCLILELWSSFPRLLCCASKSQSSKAPKTQSSSQTHFIFWRTNEQ